MRRCERCGCKLLNDFDYRYVENEGDICNCCLERDILDKMRKEKRMTSISITWGAEDIIQTAFNRGIYDITTKEVEDILSLLETEHDATIGITWDMVEYWIDFVIKERKENEKV